MIAAMAVMMPYTKRTISNGMPSSQWTNGRQRAISNGAFTSKCQTPLAPPPGGIAPPRPPGGGAPGGGAPGGGAPGGGAPGGGMPGGGVPGGGMPGGGVPGGGV